MMLSRRQLLRAGAGKTIGLGMFGRVLGYTTIPLLAIHKAVAGTAFAAGNSFELKNIRSEHVPMLLALIQASLGLTSEDLDPAAQRETLQNMDRLISQAPAPIRADLLLFFNLLQFPVSRWVMGMSSTWENATVKDVSAMIDRWNTAHIQLLRFAYQSVLALIQLSWYSRSNVHMAIGYLGPQEAIRPYLNLSKEARP